MSRTGFEGLVRAEKYLKLTYLIAANGGTPREPNRSLGGADMAVESRPKVTMSAAAARSTATNRSRIHTAREVTRHVAHRLQRVLWARAAGRCEFRGCNKALWKSSVTQEQVNIGQKAHIYSFGDGGSRSNRCIPVDQINDLGNLILVCHECHQKIDDKQDGGRYTATLLRRMKAEHEERIERVTGIAAERKSHILLYGANVGDHCSPLNYEDAVPALFPDWYPAADAPIELTTVNSSFLDRDPSFWAMEAENLQRKFGQRVKERLATGHIDRVSVFGLAPQPLLILLGTLLGDIVPAEVYQRHREPPTWEWPAATTTPAFQVVEPTTESGPPAIVLALSGTVTPDRITRIRPDSCGKRKWRNLLLSQQGPHHEDGGLRRERRYHDRGCGGPVSPGLPGAASRDGA